MITKELTTHAFESIENSVISHTFDEFQLNAAIAHNHFTLHYQPQVNLTSGEVVGFEGLLRCCDPEAGLTLPEQFMRTAEQTGKIEQLTQLAIDTGFEFIEKLSPDLSLSLNISPQSIKDTHLIDTLDNSCHEFHIDPHRVVLEITEGVDLRNTEYSDSLLKQLKMNGFRLGIDDSETDFLLSNKTNQLPFSELKIDKKYVESMVDSSQSRKAIVARIELANSLGFRTIAEGIENNLEAIGLRELGCQFGQGYYFARPMNRVDTLIWLENWNKNLTH
jgi:EAL domain-containing protein (putative c-di-GMP-specific phosphodiesterase class I)